MHKSIQKIQFSFDETNLTHYGGMFLFQRFCKYLKIKDLLHSRVTFNKRHIRYHPAVMLLIVINAIVAGILRLSGTRILYYNGSFQKFLGLRSFPHSTRLNRFLLSLDSKTLHQINRVHDTLRLSLFHKPNNRSSVILDMDSTVLTVYGNQEGSAIGFNPHKQGRPSYHPLLCFEGHTRDYWHGYFRPGNTGSASEAKPFLEECFAKIPQGIYRVRLRADAGFYSHEIVEYLDDKGVKYVITARVYSNTQAILGGLKYKDFKSGYQTAEYLYKPQKWKHEHKFVVIRRVLPKAPSLQMHLFTMDGYSYHVMVTNLNVTPQRAWHFYNNRWLAEQDIKELKENFNLSRIPTRKWQSNETYFHVLLFAYNLVNWFKRFCLPEPYIRWNLKTLRTELFLLPAKLVKNQNRNYLRLPKNYVHQKLFEHIAKKVESLKF